MSVLHPGFRRPRGQVEREVVGGGAGAGGSEERREDEQTEDGQEEARVRVTGADLAGGSRGEVGRGGAGRAEEVVRPSMGCPQRLFWHRCCCHGSRPTSRWRRFTDSLRFRLKAQT